MIINDYRLMFKGLHVVSG